MRAIVTGANGFVGSALVKKLVEKNIEVLAIDVAFNPSRLEDNSKITKLELSIENIKDLKNRINTTYDVFYHFAWLGSAGPLRCDENVQVRNAMWTVDCLREAKEIGCKKFICAGTIMEYEVHAAMYAQGSKPGAAYIYGVGKVLAHELCKPIANQIGIDLIWTYI